jgi:hypothetical protein
VATITVTGKKGPKKNPSTATAAAEAENKGTSQRANPQVIESREYTCAITGQYGSFLTRVEDIKSK